MCVSRSGSGGRFPARPAELVFNGVLELRGQRPINFTRRKRTVPFLPKAVNSSWSTRDLFDALSHSGEGRLLFFGPPGTGKTELARQLARNSWEVTMVNELLCGMEAFEGIMICATNHADNMDRAVMRRFDIRVEFRPMVPHQAWLLFSSMFSGSVPEEIRDRLDLLTLTPGNFATVQRRLSMFTDSPSPEMFLRELQEEAAQIGETDIWV